jgi:hypothetical protein
MMMMMLMMLMMMMMMLLHLRDTTAQAEDSTLHLRDTTAQAEDSALHLRDCALALALADLSDAVFSTLPSIWPKPSSAKLTDPSSTPVSTFTFSGDVSSPDISASLDRFTDAIFPHTTPGTASPLYVAVSIANSTSELQLYTDECE